MNINEHVSSQLLCCSVSWPTSEFSCETPLFKMTATPSHTSPVPLFQTLDKKKSLKLQTAHLYPFWTWPLAFWKFWTPLNSLTTPFNLEPVSYPQKRERDGASFTPSSSFQMSACTHRADCKSGKSANKNHFYETVERGKSLFSRRALSHLDLTLLYPLSFWITA